MCKPPLEDIARYQAGLVVNIELGEKILSFTDVIVKRQLIQILKAHPATLDKSSWPS
jgi:hypothetical protein